MTSQYGYPVTSNFVCAPFNVIHPRTLSLASAQDSPPSSFDRLKPSLSGHPLLSFRTTDLFEMDKMPCPSPSSGTWPVDPNVYRTPTLKPQGFSPVSASKSLVSYPYSPRFPGIADPTPQLPVSLDTISQIRTSSLPLTGPLLLNFTYMPDEGARKETLTSATDQYHSLLVNYVIKPAPFETTENLGPQISYETLDPTQVKWKLLRPLFHLKLVVGCFCRPMFLFLIFCTPYQ